MTEFEQFWQRQDQTKDKEFAEKVWHAAQRASLRTFSNPPYIPKPGEKVKFLSLCHPKLQNKVVEVCEVELDNTPNYYMKVVYSHNGEKMYTSGYLGEVEKV